MLEESRDNRSDVSRPERCDTAWVGVQHVGILSEFSALKKWRSFNEDVTDFALFLQLKISPSACDDVILTAISNHFSKHNFNAS